MLISRFSGPYQNARQAPIEAGEVSLASLGIDFAWDFRPDGLDENLVKNQRYPTLTYSPVSFANGDFESGFTGGLADGWSDDSGSVATFSEETTLPWSSPGTSAQRIQASAGAGEIDLMSKSFTITPGKMYRLSFRVKVSDAGSQVSMEVQDPSIGANYAAVRDIASTAPDTAYQVYTAQFAQTGSSLKIQIGATVGPGSDLDVLFDDFVIEEVTNGQNLVFGNSFDSTHSTVDGYEFDGVSEEQVYNGNPSDVVTLGNKFLLFGIIDPVSPGGTILSMYVDLAGMFPGTGKLWRLGIEDGVTNSDVYFGVSADGATENKYEAQDVDIYSGGAKVIMLEYDGPGGTIKLWIDNVLQSGSWTTGSFQASLFEPGMPLVLAFSTYLDSSPGFADRFNGFIKYGGVKADSLSSAKRAQLYDFLATIRDA